MKKTIFICFIFFILFSSKIFSQNNCAEKNFAFQAGEKLTYSIKYNWHFVWLNAGTITFKTNLKNYYGTPCYYFQADGSTFPEYDHFYAVRDSFSAFMDTTYLYPLRFTRNSNEGGNIIFNDIVFNNENNTIYSVISENRKAFHSKKIKTNNCIFDPLNAVYRTRNLDFSHLKINDTIPVAMVLDSTVYHIHVRYLGKTKYTSAKFGTFNCIKFNVLLISGTIFKGGAYMSVWVTDDKNRIPIHVEAPIVVGSVKVDLINYSGLRNTITSKK
ncbi:MAG TPA: DUF3108 domain-containing protein [Bacteroidia bacterium]|nr:DUF3108 domain-containing protein [Bacteroidia bacterium]